MIRRELSCYKELFREYTELRVQENRQTHIALINGDITSNTTSAKSGVSARVLKGGNWGFASNSVIDDSTIREVIRTATGNADFLGEKLDKGDVELPSRPTEAEDTFFTAKEALPQKEKIAFLKEIDNYIKETYSDLTSRTVWLSLLDMEKNLITSDGTASYSMIPLATIIVTLSKIVDGEIFEMSDRYGGHGVFEDAFTDPEHLFPEIDKLYAQLVDKTDGIFANAGIKEVILDADLAGILAHEAIGHTTEADLVLIGSVAGDSLNKQLASPLITLVDFAHTAFGEICPIPVYVDDEGVETENTVIIENGILRNFMHNKESAEHFSVAPTGNARAFDFSDEPLIRMRNTAILPGHNTLEEMIASVEDGYYLIRPTDGQADTTGEFTFGVMLGYEIKNGKIGRPIRGTTISGIAFDVLKSVTMVSDEMHWKSGNCGKKQMIPTGMGGPAIKCVINVGGK